ncbi:hypothetical protein E4U55_005806 [Claviceps digitariae]|nr:hypothetical protein E4U55_005806 [Claviceps digitariae]
MPRDRNMDNAPSGGQSKRPPLHQRDSDSQSDTTNTTGAPSQQHRIKTHQKHHHVGRLSTRVPSTKAFHKHTTAHGPAPKLTRRQTSGGASPSEPQQPPPHRRTTSEVKLSRHSSSAHLPKSLSHTSLQRNRSQVEVSKRTRSSDKLKRTSSGTGIHRHTRKTSKTQVHFDLGSDDPEDEWVDASGSNSPYLSRKGSINSSGQSSLRPGTEDPRLVTSDAPSQTQQLEQEQQKKQQQFEQQQQQEQEQQKQLKLQQLQFKQEQEQKQQRRQQQEQQQKQQLQQQLHQQQQQQEQQQQVQYPTESADKATSQQKEYLTSRLLQRNPSNSAPPMMTADMAKGAPVQVARSNNSADRTATPPTASSNQEDLISRFVGVPGSGQTSQGSFYQQPTHSTSQILDDVSRSSNSNTNLDQPHQMPQVPEPEVLAPGEMDTSSLVPRSSRGTAALPAEISRTQQKLNLQRASSVLEPGLSGAGGGIGSSPLIGVGGPGYDGGNSRDPRVGKLLEKTGMEYLVVRRYQNPVARSLNRLSRLPGMEKMRRTRPSAGTVSNIKRGQVVDTAARHTRNVSMPDTRLSASTKSGGTIRANGTGSSLEGDDVSRINERLSGVSLGGADEELGIDVLLRNLWEKSVEVSASTN